MRDVDMNTEERGGGYGCEYGRNYIPRDPKPTHALNVTAR
jgi:hypothetical protein